VGLSVSGSSAGITPRWVVIGPGAPNQPAGVTTLSLVVDLTGSSLFNVANLKLTLPPGQTFYQNGVGSDTYPGPNLVTIFPALAYDTYVSTTLGFAQAPAIPGRAFDPGPANVGNTPPGDNRDFDVAWGATPNTGPLNGTGLEIARISFFGVGFPSYDPRSAVFSSDDPNTPVFIPDPIPEPATALAAACGLGLVLMRRR
jgi:hypothetical protein